MIRNWFTYIVLMMINPLTIYGQEVQKANILKAINIGVDLVGPVGKIFEPGKTAIEMAIIAGGFKNFHFTVEGGYLNFDMSVNDTIKSYKYTSNGKFFRVGFDFNTFKKNLPGENNYVLFGLRYGFSSMNHKADNIIITDNYWTDRAANFSENGIIIHWLEVTGGLRVQLYKNIGMGWTARLKYMISQGSKSEVKPYYVPGFGKGKENLALGLTYSLYYTFPIVKMKLE